MVEEDPQGSTTRTYPWLHCTHGDRSGKRTFRTCCHSGHAGQIAPTDVLIFYLVLWFGITSLHACYKEDYFRSLLCYEVCVHTNLAERICAAVTQGSPGTASPHILFAHCLEGNSCGQHPDTIPCCAVQSRVSQLLYCAEGNKELGHNHFQSFLCCAMFYQSFCVPGVVEVPAHPPTTEWVLEARETFSRVLPHAATTKTMR